MELMNSINNKILFPLLVFAAALFAGCMPSPYYQKDVSIPQYQWRYDFQPRFRVEIKDTAALYHLYFIIRHTEAYAYSNIWMSIYTKKPGDTTYDRARIEIPLAEKSGKWLGRGMGEIWEQRMPITRDDKPMVFTKPGMYEIKFGHDMRVNPLTEILQVGLRIEKLGYRKPPSQ
jgi:gliding motility-associated lipoprotein GldH